MIDSTLQRYRKAVVPFTEFATVNYPWISEAQPKAAQKITVALCSKTMSLLALGMDLGRRSKLTQTGAV